MSGEMFKTPSVLTLRPPVLSYHRLHSSQRRQLWSSRHTELKSQGHPFKRGNRRGPAFTEHNICLKTGPLVCWYGAAPGRPLIPRSRWPSINLPLAALRFRRLCGVAALQMGFPVLDWTSVKEERRTWNTDSRWDTSQIYTGWFTEKSGNCVVARDTELQDQSFSFNLNTRPTYAGAGPLVYLWVTCGKAVFDFFFFTS